MQELNFALGEGLPVLCVYLEAVAAALGLAAIMLLGCPQSPPSEEPAATGEAQTAADPIARHGD